MNKNIFTLLTALLLCSINMIWAQNTTASDPVVIVINKDSVTFSEFRNTYAKNNDLSKVSQKDIDNYIDLYINFRLKYQQAMDMQLDTIERLQNELEGYREQAAGQYLTDKDVDERIINEALDRMQWDIRCSHILKKVALDASPADTLAAYNAIMNIRNRIIQGEDFATIAQAESDDPSAKDKLSAGGNIIQYGNHGDLGYFTVFDMIYSFECGAYNTPVGQLSMPIRSEFGYHLIFVQDKQPALGKRKAKQILLPFNRNVNLNEAERSANAKQVEERIKEAYADLQQGMNFEEARKKYMGETVSANEIPLFGCNRFEGDFIAALYPLKKNEYSRPVKTMYGWHIILVTDVVPVEINKDTRANVKSRIMRDSRSNKSKEAFVERVKKENGFQEIKPKKGTRPPVEDFYIALDSNIFVGKYTADMVDYLQRDMFVLGGKTYTQKDFARYLEKYPFTNLDPSELKVLVNYAYKRFIERTAIELENSKLEDKYPAFANLMKEYKEGILIYELNENKIWRKAENDSVGLEKFYESVKDQYLYPIRIQALRIKCVDAATADKVNKYLAHNKAISAMNSKFNHKNVSIVMDTVMLEKGKTKDNDIIVRLLTSDNSDYIACQDNTFYRTLQVLQPSPKPLKEIKGIVISAYQDKLEQDWIKELHNNAHIWVDRTRIYQLIK